MKRKINETMDPRNVFLSPVRLLRTRIMTPTRDDLNEDLCFLDEASSKFPTNLNKERQHQLGKENSFDSSEKRINKELDLSTRKDQISKNSQLSKIRPKRILSPRRLPKLNFIKSK